MHFYLLQNPLPWIQVLRTWWFCFTQTLKFLISLFQKMLRSFVYLFRSNKALHFSITYEKSYEILTLNFLEELICHAFFSLQWFRATGIYEQTSFIVWFLDWNKLFDGKLKSAVILLMTESERLWKTLINETCQNFFSSFLLKLNVLKKKFIWST